MNRGEIYMNRGETTINRGRNTVNGRGNIAKAEPLVVLKKILRKEAEYCAQLRKHGARKQNIVHERKGGLYRKYL